MDHFEVKNTPWASSTVASVPSTHRLLRIATFNDFAAYVNNSALTQWNFIISNMVDDDHNISINHAAQWLQH